MPTPDLKSKEMIYWVRVKTKDERLLSDLERLLNNPPKQLDLRVPTQFIWAKVELESYLPKQLAGISQRISQTGQQDRKSQERQERASTVEIILRRQIQDSPKTQSPYG